MTSTRACRSTSTPRPAPFLRSCGNGTRWRYPAYLDYDAQGRLAVADSRGHKIVMTNDANCNVLFQFGTQGGGASQFNTPRGIDFAPDGTLWINDTNNRRVEPVERRRDRPRPGSSSFPVESGDLRGLMYRNGEVYCVNAATARVNVYNATTGALARFWGGYGTADGKFVDGGRGIAADGSGNVWVADMPGFRTQKFTPQGQFLLGATEPPGPPPVGGYALPEGVAADDDGTVVGIDSFNWRVNVHNADGTPRLAFGTRNNFNYPRGIAMHRSANTIVVGNTDSAQVDKYSMTGQRLWTADGREAVGRRVDQVDGRIYAAEFIANRIRVVNSNGSLGATFTGGLSNPRGVAVDPTDRSIWVSNQGSGRIVHFSSTGQTLGSFASGAEPGHGHRGQRRHDLPRRQDRQRDPHVQQERHADRNVRRWRLRARQVPEPDRSRPRRQPALRHRIRRRAHPRAARRRELSGRNEGNEGKQALRGGGRGVRARGVADRRSGDRQRGGHRRGGHARGTPARRDVPLRARHGAGRHRRRRGHRQQPGREVQRQRDADLGDRHARRRHQPVRQPA